MRPSIYSLPFTPLEKSDHRPLSRILPESLSKTFFLTGFIICLLFLPSIVFAEVKDASAEHVKIKEEDNKRIHDFIEKWRESWEKKNLDTYMSCYSTSFKSKGMDWDAWKRHKASLNRVDTLRKVSISGIKISQQSGNIAASFIQEYIGENTKGTGLKKLHLDKTGDDIKIIGEEWSALQKEDAQKAAKGSSADQKPQAVTPDKKTGKGKEPILSKNIGQKTMPLPAFKPAFKKEWRDFYMKKAVMFIVSTLSEYELTGYSDLKESSVLADSMKAFKNGDIKEAIVIIEGFIRENPDSPQIPLALYLAGRLSEKMGFSPEANASYDRLISKYSDKPYSLNAFMGKVRIAYLADKFKEANDLLSKVQGINDDGVMLALASTYERLGDFDKALDIMKRGRDKAWILEGKDGRAIYLLSLAEAFIAKGDFNGAKEIYENVQKFYAEKDVLLYTVLRQSDIALKEGRKKDADSLYRMALKVGDKDDDGEAAANMAIAEFKENLGDESGAIKLYKEVAENPGTPSNIAEAALVKIGEIYRKSERYEDALSSFKKAQEYKRDRKTDAVILIEDTVNTWLGILYNNGRYRDVANSYYENKRVRIEPENMLHIADSFFKLGLLKEAEDMYKVAAVVLKDSQKNEAYMGIAKLALQNGDVKAAASAISKIDNNYKKNESYLDIETAVGDIYMKNGSYKEALAYYLDVMKNREHPSYYKTVLKTATSYQKAGQHPQAIEYYKFIIDGGGKDKPELLFSANLGIGDSFYAINKFDMAVKAYEEALLFTEGDKEQKIWALYRIGEANLKLNRIESASKAFEKAGMESDDSNLLKKMSMERIQDIKKMIQ
ncbi:MAG: tetratricopeptide repeat protein [Deltaproteobacteria bacterium]|nr:tetratricopeptide repeat protein [Deltaproteobacteria bacterium]